MKADRRGLDQLIKQLRKMKGGRLEWGFYDDDTYTSPRGWSSVATVAFNVENGHANGGWFDGTVTPPRPFFSTAVNDKDNISELQKAIKRLQREVLNGKMQPEEKMRQLGEIVVRQVQESIRNFRGAKLADSTIKVRDYRDVSSTDPLRESDTMYESVRAKVNGEFVS